MSQMDLTWRAMWNVRNHQRGKSSHQKYFSPRPDRAFPNACEQLAAHFSQQEFVNVVVGRGGKWKVVARTPGPYVAKLIRHPPIHMLKTVFYMRKMLRLFHSSGKPIILRIHHAHLIMLEDHQEYLKAREVPDEPAA